MERQWHFEALEHRLVRTDMVEMGVGVEDVSNFDLELVDLAEYSSGIVSGIDDNAFACLLARCEITVRL